MNPIGAVGMATVEQALDGLAARSDVRAHNLANVNTPGFQAQRVDFETALAAAVRAGRSPAGAAIATSADPNLPSPNGNTVNVENELVGMMKDNLMRDAMVNAFNFQAGALRTAIQGR